MTPEDLKRMQKEMLRLKEENEILKKEEVYGTQYVTFEQANLALFQYIEGFYNRKRIHSSIGYKTPQAIEDLAKNVA
ncbi:hypothetical protein KOY_04123 [Bacillus cereus VDM021]|nr:hypothetical protein IIW_00981 [Bacillus cereus VD136]EOP72905.1 hypothetical protein KOW_00315 [Bacillus cereus VDM006]EOQ10561.1 hypothetical protein KOY_04123 [Bacillus cereus VDM021]OOG90826.1 hypothetical protein BTH41_02551 [Bacillus mycoides]